MRVITLKLAHVIQNRTYIQRNALKTIRISNSRRIEVARYLVGGGKIIKNMNIYRNLEFLRA